MPALFVYEKDLVDPTPQIPSLEGKVIFVTGAPIALPFFAQPYHVKFAPLDYAPMNDLSTGIYR
ncbi:short-chain dehydrogenase/reductase family Oxidoreductase [Colletotrichum tofieldiae]|nr:short-chain dehydrogenase/reductase family Oxidoreductase [Colletotrichum tofieldiae]